MAIDLNSLNNTQSQVNTMVNQAYAQQTDPVGFAKAQKDNAVLSDPLMNAFNIYTDKSGNTYVNSTQGETFFVPTKDGSVPKDFTNNINEARNKVLAAVGPNGISGLLSRLYTSGFITKSQLKSQDYISGLNDAIRQYSVNALQEYQLNKGQGGFPSMGTFLQKFTVNGVNTGDLSGTKTSTTEFTTTRGRADADLTLYYMDNVGQPPTQQEKDDYYNQVVKAEKNNTTNAVTTTDSVGAIKNQVQSDSRLTNADYLVMQAATLKKTFAGTKADVLLNSKNPGQIVTDINLAMKYGSDYGLTLTPQQALNYVSDSFGQQNYMSKVQDKMKQLAITTMPNLASHIQAGGTVKDVADVYASVKSRKLGVTIADSTQDPQIMSAINLKGGMLNMADYERQLQADPQWRKTAEAHTAVDNFTNTILQSFGFGGN